MKLAGFLNLRNYFKKSLYLSVFICFSASHAGSYDDFFSAVRRDDAAAISALLTRGFDANSRDEKGQHALFLAIREPSPKVTQVLLDWDKTTVESRNGADESPLMMAALKGQLAVATRLIARGADVNKPGWAPLHYAATAGHVDLINLLLENHAYIDASSPNASTPLMMAALYGSPSAVKVLLEAGADPDIKNNIGLTAIDFAYRDNRADAAGLIAAFIRGRQPKGKW